MLKDCFLLCFFLFIWFILGIIIFLLLPKLHLFPGYVNICLHHSLGRNVLCAGDHIDCVVVVLFQGEKCCSCSLRAADAHKNQHQTGFCFCPAGWRSAISSTEASWRNMPLKLSFVWRQTPLNSPTTAWMTGKIDSEIKLTQRTKFCWIRGDAKTLSANYFFSGHLYRRKDMSKMRN